MLDNYKKNTKNTTKKKKKKKHKKPQKQYMQIFTYVLSVTKKKKLKIKITFDPLQCYRRKKNIYIYIYNAIVACQRLYIMQW